MSVSLPMRGEWIEIRVMPGGHTAGRSLPMRGEWIEMASAISISPQVAASLPMRGEWIEIVVMGKDFLHAAVSPHAGRVD